MNPFPTLTTLPAGLTSAVGKAGNTRGGAPAAPLASSANAAELFGFAGESQAAHRLGVPQRSGASAAQLEARFLDCLFQRG